MPGPRQSSTEATTRDIEEVAMLKLTGLVAAVGLLLTATPAILATHIAMPRPASAHEDHGHFSAGAPGEPYEPARIEVRRGEQIRFVLQNDGEEDHEFILATVAENRKHAEVMKKNPNMEHDDPNAKHLLPHGNSELIWKFTKRGQFEFACLIPGHYEKGMFGQIIVK